MRTRWRAVVCALSLGASCAPCIGSGGAQAQGAVARLGVGALPQNDAVRDSTRRSDSVRAAERRIDVDLRDVPLKDALKTIARDGGVVLFYNDRDIPARKRVTIALKNAAVSDAVRDVLRGTGMTVRATERGIVIEKGRESVPAAERADTVGGITGSVVDSTTGEGVAGAGVTLVGTTRGASTDANGDFRITGVTAGRHTIVARRLGYRPISLDVVVRADSDVTVRLSMVPAPKRLDQIVTTATGDQARKEVGNLVAAIAADSVVSASPVTNLTQLLAGRVPGVRVQFGGGLTGASPPISIRGQSSLSLSNQPLLVVDGVRVANSTAGGVTAPTAAGLSSGRFDDLELADIESIEIVKGPSAATLYGTDAANGVILVKTKRGKTSEARWSASAEGGILSFDRDRFPVSYFPWGHAIASPDVPIRCPLLGMNAGTCTQDSITSFSPLREAATTPIGTGSRQKIGLQVSGGASVRYLLSVVREVETGYLKMPSTDGRLLEEQAGRSLTDDERHPNGISRYSVRGNFQVPVRADLDLDFSAAFSHSNVRIPNPLMLFFGGLSTGVRDQNDGWTRGVRAGDYLIKRDREDVSHLTTGINARWHPTGWLTGRLTAGLDLSTDYIDRLAPPGLGFSSAIIPGSRENTKLNISLQTLDGSLSAQTSLGSDWSLRTSIGAQYNRTTALTNTAAARNLVPGSETVAGGAAPLVSESTVETVVAGSYIEETIGWAERRYITAALRVDGASSFGAGFRAAVYPKASASWVLSSEPFWPRIPGISSVRLRAAYGESGVQPGPVAALQTERLFTAFVGQSTVTGAQLGELGNRDLRPERQSEFEGGLDVEAANGRIAMHATYYDKRSDDALVRVTLPASFGGGSQWQNVGAVRNRGYELMLQANILQTQRLSWGAAVSGSVNDNTVLAIAPSVDAIYRAGTTYPGIVPGYPLKSYFDYPIESVTDADGNGIITPAEVTVGDSPRLAGRGFPRTQLTLSTDLGFFGDRLRLSAMAEHRGGYSILNGAEAARCLFSACHGTTFQGDDLEAQAAYIALSNSSLHNSYWGYFEDASFTRLREVALSFAIPPSLAARLHVRDANLMISARNLALWSKYSGTDPEVQTAPGNPDASAGDGTTALPAPRYLILRLSIAF